MKIKFATIGLILLLIPFVAGCEIGPEDKWPVIINWDFKYNLDCTLDVSKTPDKLTFGDTDVEVFISVRSYNTNQDFKITLLLDSAVRSGTYYSLDLQPIDTFTTNIVASESWISDPAVGTYIVGSGKPPQGIKRLGPGIFTPALLPRTASGWLTTGSVYTLTERIVFTYLVIVEDAGGRSDSFTIKIDSNLTLKI